MLTLWPCTCVTAAACAVQVLREHKEALLTVVQVVLHDPMYRWQMTTTRALRKQQDPMQPAPECSATAAATAVEGNAANGGSTGNNSTSRAGSVGPGSGAAGAASDLGDTAGGASIGNADAERAVLRVKQKLDGQDVEGGVALTVEAQVGLLLQTAQDPERLCRMYAGWAAWM